MKRLFLLAILVSCSYSWGLSQIPDGYYDKAHDSYGHELKTRLYSIIKGHTEFPYSSSSTDTWDILKESDRDTANAANVILFYTGWSVNAAQEFNDGSGWNREHVWAKSRGDFGTSPGAGTDAHHLRPSDISVNKARSSRWFDTCSVLLGSMEILRAVSPMMQDGSGNPVMPLKGMWQGSSFICPPAMKVKMENQTWK